MNVVFWNTHNNESINEYIVELVKYYSVDLLILAEYKANKDELDCGLLQTGQGLRCIENFVCKRIVAYTNYIDVDIGPEDSYSTSFILSNEYVFCALHLFTDLYGNAEDERLDVIRDIKRDIETFAKNKNTNKIVFVGDFNEMPYDKACLSANGMHGLPSYIENEKAFRIVKYKSYKKYFNPMWECFGNGEYPPGTYFYDKANLVNPLWYILDQYIISWELAASYSKNDIKIITTIGGKTLYDESKHPDKNISDHFPVYYRLEGNKNE